jgi:hypothetical protein
VSLKTWPVTLCKDHRLRVSENRVSRRTFGSKREEVAGDWRTLHSEKLLNILSSPILMKRSHEGGCYKQGM